MKLSKQYPLDQLRIAHEELNRQRDAVARRHDSIRTRAAVLVGAAAIGQAFITQHASVWGWASGLLALLAAVLGVLALLVKSVGEDVLVEELRNNAVAGADVYSVEWQLVDDKIKAHRFDENALNLKRLLVLWGFTILVVSWIAGILTIGLGGYSAAHG